MVQAVLAGDVPAREALLRRLTCVAKFLRALNQRHGSPLDSHEVEDVVQETLLALWRKLDRYRGSGSLGAWALGTARLEFRAAVRKHARRNDASASFDPKESTAGEPELVQADERVDGDALAQALARLDPVVEQTIRLKHFAGITFEGIGRRMECSANTAKARYYRGLTQIARVLKRPSP
jgi:RNA polymerase sigma-70 factor (ECF subfamily)